MNHEQGSSLVISLNSIKKPQLPRVFHFSSTKTTQKTTIRNSLDFSFYFAFLGSFNEISVGPIEVLILVSISTFGTISDGSRLNVNYEVLLMKALQNPEP